MAIVNEPVGQPVRSLQIMLRAIAQYDEEVLSVIPDGIYSEDTVASVSSFQKRHGLPVTGETDLQTWYAVADEYRHAMIEIGPAQPVNIILKKGQVIRAGEVNEHLYMMHGMLRSIGDYYPSMPRVSCNNVHDEESVAAIRWLQARADMEPTGEITRLTWKYLSLLYRTTVGDGAVPASMAPRSKGDNRIG